MWHAPRSSNVRRHGSCLNFGLCLKKFCKTELWAPHATTAPLRTEVRDLERSVAPNRFRSMVSIHGPWGGPMLAGPRGTTMECMSWQPLVPAGAAPAGSSNRLAAAAGGQQQPAVGHSLAVGEFFVGFAVQMVGVVCMSKQCRALLVLSAAGGCACGWCAGYRGMRQLACAASATRCYRKIAAVGAAGAAAQRAQPTLMSGLTWLLL